MAAFFADLSILEWLYLAFFCVGLIYALFLAIFGLGHGTDLDHAGDLHGGLGDGLDLDHGGDFHGLDLDHGGDFHGLDLDHGLDVGHGGDVSVDAGDLHVEADHAVGQDVDFDGDISAKSHPLPLNPLVIATFLGGLGGFGILGTRALGLLSIPSLLIALPAGLALGGGVYYLYSRLLMTGEVDSSISQRDLFRLPAEVFVSIPEKGLGEIVYVAKGSRYNSPARAVDGSAIAKGTAVTILKMDGAVAVVDLRYAD